MQVQLKTNNHSNENSHFAVLTLHRKINKYVYQA